VRDKPIYNSVEEATSRTMRIFIDIRMLDWILLALFLFVLLWIIRTPSTAEYLTAIGVPGDIIVLVHKAATIALGGVGGLWFDRSMFYYARPDRIVRNPDDAEPWDMGDAVAFSGACIRRAIIAASFMFASALAL
jgi:hypothetical protein